MLPSCSSILPETTSTLIKVFSIAFSLNLYSFITYDGRKSNGQQVKSNEQRAKTNHQRGESNNQGTKSSEQQVKSNKERVKSNEQRVIFQW